MDDMRVSQRGALWIDGACGLAGASYHVVIAAFGGLGVAPNVWRAFAFVSVLYAVVAWASTRAPSAGLTRMIWLNRAWVVVCLISAVAIATGFARVLLAGEAVVVGALSVWEARLEKLSKLTPSPTRGG